MAKIEPPLRKELAPPHHITHSQKEVAKIAPENENERY